MGVAIGSKAIGVVETAKPGKACATPGFMKNLFAFFMAVLS